MIGGLIVLALMAVVFLSGCVSQDNTKSPASPQVATTPAANTGANVPPESLVQQADVPELIFSGFYYISARTDREYNYSTKDATRSSKTKDQIVSSYKEVGQASSWVNRDQKSLNVQVHVFDSNVGNGKEIPDQLSYCTTDACGSADIGDASYYHTDPYGSGTEVTTLAYAKGEYFVCMSYQDKTGKSFEETIRIGKAIESRLKPQAAAINILKAEKGSGIPPVSVIKHADVPELELGSFFYMITKANQEFNYSTKDKASLSPSNDDNGGTYKVVGQMSQWFDNERMTTNIQVVTFETSVGNGEDLPELLSECKHVFCGSVNVGSASFYYTDPWGNPLDSTSGQTTLYFSKGNHFVTIKISGRNGANYNEAARLAGIVESRLK